MKKPKRIPIVNAEATLIRFINECDVDDLCAIIDNTFGTKSYFDPSTEELLIVEPDGELYANEFGEFEELKLVQNGCECSNGPENTIFVDKGQCECKIENPHTHCEKCGGFVQMA